MSAGIARKLQAAFPGVKVVGSMSRPGNPKGADGRVLAVQEKTCPVRVALHTSWGSVTLDPFSFAAMPGDDDLVILGNATLTMLGIDVYDSFGGARMGARGPCWCRYHGVPAVSPSHRPCRCLTAAANELHGGRAG